MSSVLFPNDEDKKLELAQQRELPRVRDVPSPEPLPTPDSVPTIPSEPVVPELTVPPSFGVSPQEQPLAPTVDDGSTGIGVIDPNQSFTPETPQVQPSSGIDNSLTESTIDPFIYRAEELQRQLSPSELVEASRSVAPRLPNIQWSRVPKVEPNVLNQKINELIESNKFRVEQNKTGLNNFHVSSAGTPEFSVSAVDNALVGTGVTSNLLKKLQDVYDPQRQHNTTTGLLSWLYDLTTTTSGLTQGVVGWLGSSVLNVPYRKEILDALPDSIGNTLDKVEAWEQEGWKKAQFNRLDGSVDLQGNTPNNKYNSTFDITKGQWGDFGNHPLLSPLLYGLNLPESILMGAVYDVADALGFKPEGSKYNTSRVLGALAGRDWGVSNRWSPEKYISLQEPEGQVGGQKTGNPYWDFPEWLADKGLGNYKVNHIVLQTIPAVLGEFITGGVSDYGTGKIGSILRQTVNNLGTGVVNALPVNSLPDIPVGVLPEEGVGVPRVDIISKSTISPDDVQPVLKVDLPKQSTTIPETSLENLVRDTIVKDLPNGYRVSDDIVRSVDEGRLITRVDTTQLNNTQLTWLAKNTYVDGSPLLPNNFTRPLTDLEASFLNQRYGSLLDRYQVDIPNAVPEFLNPNSQDAWLFNPDKAGSVPTKPVFPVTGSLTTDIVKAYDELLDVTKQASYKAGLDDIESPNAWVESNTGGVVKANFNFKALETSEVAESRYKTASVLRLPESMVGNSTSARTIGTEYTNVEAKLVSQRVVIDQLTTELDTLKEVRNTVEENLKVIKPVGRDYIEDGLATLETFGEMSVPELGISQYDPPVLPLLEEIPDPIRTPESFLSKEENRLWLHGSASPISIREVNLQTGGTPSELGLGVYLTKSDDIAEQAALGIPQANRPPRPDVVDTVPYKITVDVSKLGEVIDLNKPAPTVLRQYLKEYTKQVVGKYVAETVFSNTKLPMKEVWNKIREVFFDLNGYTISEVKNRELQQFIHNVLVRSNIDAGYVETPKGTMLVVYNPQKLQVFGNATPLEPPTINQQLSARAWLDHQTNEMLPDPVNLDNAQQSKFKFINQVTQDTAEKLSKELDTQKKGVEDLIVAKDELEKVVRKERKELVQNAEATGDSVSNLKSTMRKDIVESKVQAKKKNTTKRDYSVPKASRPIVEKQVDETVKVNIKALSDEPTGIPLENKRVPPEPTGEGSIGKLYEGRTEEDRLDSFLVRYAYDDKADVGMLENTFYNHSIYERSFKKPDLLSTNKPLREYVPSTGQVVSYDNWEDFKKTYTLSKYQSNAEKSKITMKANKTIERELSELIDEVSNTDAEIRKLFNPIDDNPCV